MTVKQLYEWAKKEGKEDYVLLYGGDWSYPFVVDYNSTEDDVVGLLVNTGLDDYYGQLFDGEKMIYLQCGEEVPEEEFNRAEEDENED